jgi:UDP-N-acetylglucosamine--N-acetylmuramyl-(pentapeptide) pyrophosphoryl-undecaprenol N-acetylglucosamine transferase
LLIAASGTGGHVFPAIAVAEHLPNWQIEWLGVPDRMEVQLVQGKYRLHTIRMSGLQGSRWRAWFTSLSQLAAAVIEVRRLLQQQNFVGVLATGGYIAAPAILAARSLNLPVILHESNAIPGKVTRWLGRFCTVVALGMAEAADHLPGIRSQVVGTPVRSHFWQPSTCEALEIPPQVPVITVIGGSQGARGLNRMVLQCASAWLEAGAWIVHLTGEIDAAAVAELAPHHPHYLRFAFWQDMASLLQRTSFTVSRAGAATLAELAATQTPAILIPYPYAAEDHQYHNGIAFARSGGAVVLRESLAHSDPLRVLGLEWLQDPTALARRRTQLQSLAVQEAGQRMAQLLEAELL